MPLPPEISAIITTHRRPLAVRDALASVRSEAHRDFELIVVDDGGTFVPPRVDAALHVVRGFSLGVARARNLGLEQARGEFVIYLDDDDVALPNRMATLLAAARRNDASLCFGMTRRIVDGRPADLEDVPTRLVSSGAVGFCDLLTCAPHVDAVLVRADVLRSVGGFDAGVDHFDDWSAWLRIADRGAVVWGVPETVAEWRIHARGLSGKVHGSSAMKQRIVAFFATIQRSLSMENADAVEMARQIAEASDIATYDDYVEAVAAVRSGLHGVGSCFGQPLPWHPLQQAV